MDEQATPSPGQRRPTPNGGRNLKACDVCRSRKVKCRYPVDAEVCEGCNAAGVECTQRMLRRKRGPGKRSTATTDELQLVAPSIPAYSPSTLTTLEGTSPSLSTTQHRAFDSHSPQVSVNYHTPRQVAEDVGFHGLCSRATLLAILTDWATFIWPMAPLLHKKKFMARVLSREDERNPVFCALVLSMCAVTVSTHQRRWMVKCPSITTERCIEVVEKEQMLKMVGYNVDWCIASYNVASSLTTMGVKVALRTYQSIRDAVAGVHWLLLHDDDMKTGSLEDREALKRLYWLMYMWQLESELRGELHFTCLPSLCFARDLAAIRPNPLSDSELEVQESEQLIPPDMLASLSSTWFKDTEEFVTGLNSLIDVALVWEQAKIDMTHKKPEESLLLGMTRLQTVLDNMIPELRWQGGLARFPRPTPAHEAQAINILITSLYIRSNLLQHLGPGPGITHHDIVTDVLNILDYIPTEIHEANGISLVRKIRDIGAAYLTELPLASHGSPGTDDGVARHTVNTLLARLEGLDSWPTGR